MGVDVSLSVPSFVVITHYHVSLDIHFLVVPDELHVGSWNLVHQLGIVSISFYSKIDSILSVGTCEVHGLHVDQHIIFNRFIVIFQSDLSLAL